MARQLARRRRRERLAGTLLTILGVVVLVVAVFALRHPHKTATAAGTSTRTSTATGSVTVSPSHSPSGTATGTPAGTSAGTPTVTPATHGPSSSTHPVPLVVLNNTTVHGLAQQAKATFEAGGWTVSSTGNLTNDIVSTCAYYDPNTAGAQAAAEQLQAQFPAIKRVKPRFASLPSGPIVVVLTPDYSTG